MSVGTIETSILTDIANAIRYQAGVATTYKPRQMAAVVAALDGTDAGGYVPQPYKQLQSGVPSSSVFEDLADAIRVQNGSSAQYAPGDMAQAILDLTWDVGVKARTLWLDDGTLEFNYRDGRSSDLGTIVQCWEINSSGFASGSALALRARSGQEGRLRLGPVRRRRDQLRLLVHGYECPDRGARLRGVFWVRQCDADVHELQPPGVHLRHELRQQLDHLLHVGAVWVQPPGGWYRLRTYQHGGQEQPGARVERRADKPDERLAHVGMGPLL